MESMRKDVEDAFGILKIRFAPLRQGTNLRTDTDTEAIMRTCCALHNRLLEHDGLDKGWGPSKKPKVDNRAVQVMLAEEEAKDAAMELEEEEDHEEEEGEEEVGGEAAEVGSHGAAEPASDMEGALHVDTEEDEEEEEDENEGVEVVEVVQEEEAEVEERGE